MPARRRMRARIRAAVPLGCRRKRQFRDDTNGDRLAVFQTRLESPLFHRVDSRSVESALTIQRFEHLDSTHGPIPLNDTLEQNGTVDSGVLGSRRVVWANFLHEYRNG